MNEWLEIYWAIFYVGRDFAFIIAAIFIVLGILRPIKLYAFAEPIIIDDDFVYSSFLIRTVWRVAVRLGIEEENETNKDDVGKPYGAHLYGTGIDAAATLIIGLLLSWLWPVLVIFLIGVFPVQAMHTHHKRKKDFVANLKGEQLEEA
jgi:hypothetical protein